MNKLVSKNPILRFKLGKKILKFGGGDRFQLVGYTYFPGLRSTDSEYVFYDKDTGNLLTSDVPNITSVEGTVNRGNNYSRYGYSWNSEEYKPKKSSNINLNLDPNRVAKKRDYKKGEVTYHLDKNTNTWYAKWNDPTKPNQGYYKVAEGSTGYNRNGDHNVLKNGKWVKIDETPVKETVKERTSGVVSTTPYTRNTEYNDQYGLAGDIQRDWRGTKGVIADNDLKLLLEMGFQIKDLKNAAREAQLFIRDNGLGQYNVALDNAWGSQSSNALNSVYQMWRAKKEADAAAESLRPKSTPSSTIQLPQAPVMLRQAISDYSNYASNLKSALGNNNNFQGLSNLVWKEYADDDNSFAANFSRDMRTRFKNYNTQLSWLDNQAAIEKLLNISGRYRGSRSGDYGDLVRSQASWAGKYNQGIDKLNLEALNNYDALINRYKRAIGGYKIGGQLVSRNPVKRFKLKKFLVGGPVTTLKTGGEIPKLKTAWLPIINWNDNNKFVDKVVENVSNGMKEALNRVENYRKANKVANRNTRAPLINNTAKLLQALYDKGFYKGVIDKKRTGKQVTLERAVDGYEGDMTNQAILNAINAGYTVNKNTGEITPPRKLAYGKTPKKLSQQLQQASTFSFDKLKSLGKEFYGRVFGDKDMLTGRNEQEEKEYQRIYNTPYSWRLDMDKIGETDGGEAGYLYPQFDSKVGKLGLFNRQVDEDGRVCYQIKNDKGQLVTRCSETANLINRALGLPTTDDAWKRYGVYGDSLIYGQPDHNKFYTRPVGKVINGLRPDLLDPNNLKTGDFVDLYTEGSGHNAEAATGRGNSHTGTIYRPQGDKGPIYIIHGGINERAYVDPLAQFGPTHTWSIMSVRRPGSKEHPYYED